MQFVCLSITIGLYFSLSHTQIHTHTHVNTLLRAKNKKSQIKKSESRSLRRPLKGALPRPTSADSISVSAGAASTELSAQEPPGLFVFQIFYYRYFLRLREHAISFQDRSWPLVIS